ncbi:MAG: FHA domain-containing protein [Gemmatimonadaceae bacterium]|nr:FHA domain-containing protein [Gemmatimonadaceae bacterium]NUQ93552.1 FHA domain-containing protein [Gemmatimonadaceae bacterium]NUR18569.1 FHA domain-containing protein [Gemmatimonadaceae bacterium]NUS98653.1 FHA domain-containing protein [Gemmatimonadaceae bacterium]
MAFKLISTEGEQTFELRSGGTLVVGRALTSDIPVLDPTISRRHAEVAWDDSGVHVRDLGSSNGTFLNGVKVETARLSPGDVITFGKVPFRLREITADPRSTAADTPTSFSAPVPAGATIVRKLPTRDSRQAFASYRTSGAARVVEETTPIRSEDDKNEQKLALLLEVSKGLTSAVDVDALLEKIVGEVYKILDVDRVAILLVDDQGDLQPKIARDKRGVTAGRMVPQSIVRKVVEEKVAILSDNTLEDQRFGGQSIVMQRVRSAMCGPLIGSEDRVLGVLYVDNLTTAHRFSEDDLEFLIAFAGIAGVAIENSQFADRIRRETLARSNFERFFAPGLAARIASSPDAVRLGGEKRQVAVLFSDIRGFTALSETMTPDEIAKLLTEYFTEMVECVFRNGGTLDKFIGDAVMAQWGAPIGEPDDADRAMRAAIEMMTALDQLNAKWRVEGKPQLSIGIGLNFGEVFAGNIGSERRLEFTVIGDTVNTASRLCSAADGGEILLSDDFRRSLREPPRIEERPAIELKGKSQRIPLYRVTTS